MNRNLMRYTLIGLILLAAVFAAVPEIVRALGIHSSWTNFGTISEKPVTRGACVDEGVTLVVDFGPSSNRATQTWCAATYGQVSTNTGWSLFAAAHLTVSGTADYPTGFVCRIEGFPTSKTESCQHVPNSGSGSWAYFTATDASGWHYSQVGASVAHPKCGSWQGWRYIEAGAVRIAPPRVAAAPFKCNG